MCIPVCVWQLFFMSFTMTIVKEEKSSCQVITVKYKKFNDAQYSIRIYVSWRWGPRACQVKETNTKEYCQIIREVRHPTISHCALQLSLVSEIVLLWRVWTICFFCDGVNKLSTGIWDILQNSDDMTLRPRNWSTSIWRSIDTRAAVSHFVNNLSIHSASICCARNPKLDSWRVTRNDLHRSSMSQAPCARRTCISWRDSWRAIRFSRGSSSSCFPSSPPFNFAITRDIPGEVYSPSVDGAAQSPHPTDYEYCEYESKRVVTPDSPTRRLLDWSVLRLTCRHHFSSVSNSWRLAE